MKGEYDAKKLAVKELERQKKQLDEKLKPLEELKKSSVAMHQTAVKELGARKDQTQKVGAKVDEDTRISDYLKTNGAFALLKPARLAVDRQRPADPSRSRPQHPTSGFQR